MDTRTELAFCLEEKQFREAISLVRRVSRQPLDSCRRFISELSSGEWSWAQLAQIHPSLVAALAGDPDPSLLSLLDPQRNELFSALRRGRKLHALRLVQERGGVSAVAAKSFLDRLVARGLAWDEVLERYRGEVEDFWAEAPQGPGLPARPAQDGVWVPPETFVPDQYRELVSTGQVGRAASLVRRFARCSLETAHRFVEASETAEWGALGQQHPSVLSALAGHPDPVLLERLEPVQTELLGALRDGHKLRASRLVQDGAQVGLTEARRLLTHLQRHELKWDAFVVLYREGKFHWPAEIRPVLVEKKPRPAVKPPTQDLRLAALEALRQQAPKLAELVAYRPLPQSLPDLVPLLEELQRADLDTAAQALTLLEARGLNRDRLVATFPALEILPPGPLASHVDQFGRLLPLLQAGQFVEAAAEQIPDEFEAPLQALQEKNPEKLRELALAEIRRRFPQLDDERIAKLRKAAPEVHALLRRGKLNKALAALQGLGLGLKDAKELLEMLPGM